MNLTGIGSNEVATSRPKEVIRTITVLALTASQGVERHRCRESRDGRGMALRRWAASGRAPGAMMERGNVAKRSNSRRLARRVSEANQPDEVGPDARGKTSWLLLAGPAIRAFARSDPP